MDIFQEYQAKIEILQIICDYLNGSKAKKNLGKFAKKYDKNWLNKLALSMILNEDVFERIRQLKESEWHRYDFLLSKLFAAHTGQCNQELVRMSGSLKFCYNMLDDYQKKEMFKRHLRLFSIINRVLYLKMSLNQATKTEIADYLINVEFIINTDPKNKEMENILKSMYDKNTEVFYVVQLLKLLPTADVQMAMKKQIDFIVKLLSRKFDPDKQTTACVALKKVIQKCENVFDSNTFGHIFNYLEMLITRWKDDDTHWCALDALRVFPLNEIECKNIKLICEATRELTLTQNEDLPMHRLMCKWMEAEFRLHDELISRETSSRMFNYLVKLFDCFTMHPSETVLLGILCAERMCLQGRLESEQKEKLSTKIEIYQKCITNVQIEVNESIKWQVAFCARWCIDNVLGESSHIDDLPLVKLLPDLYWARNDTFHPQSVRSLFEATKTGVYYYEVILLTDGWMQFGWSSSGAQKSSVKKRINKDGHWIGLDEFDNCVWYKVNNSSCWKVGDVVGCLIDIDTRKFEHFLNGRQLKFDQICPTNLSYYAEASLSVRQQCYFNFGQQPFKHCPENVLSVSNFHSASNGNIMKYKLLPTCLEFMFCDTLSNTEAKNNKVELFYQDEAQQKCDKLAKQIEDQLLNDRPISKWKAKTFDLSESRQQFWKFVMMVMEGKNKIFRPLFDNRKTDKCLRFIQSAIEAMGTNLYDPIQRIDILASYIGEKIENQIDRTYEEMLCGMIFPYLLQRNETDRPKHRIMCIVLLSLIKCCHHYGYGVIARIRTQVFNYLTWTITECDDKWTQLFALIALEDFGMDMDECEAFRQNNVIMQLLTSKASNTFKVSREMTNYEILECQLSFCSEWFLRHVLNLNSNEILKEGIIQATLNPADATSNVKLSEDFLSVRSDWNWQSVRSICKASGECIYYFEVTLLTSGLMIIGWATKRAQLEGSKVGDDEFSIGFNGFDRCIEHEGKYYSISGIDSWKGGDVIGCLIDISNQIFVFALNGHELTMPSNLTVYFSSLPYFACASLSDHQQCHFNFGQTPFQHGPKRIDYLDFCLQVESLNQNEVNTKTKPTITYQLNDVTNSQVLIESTNTTGNISMVSSKQSTSTTNGASQVECVLCSEKNSTKLLSFVCCGILTLCHDCVSKVPECTKCKSRITSN